MTVFLFMERERERVGRMFMAKREMCYDVTLDCSFMRPFHTPVRSGLFHKS